MENSIAEVAAAFWKTTQLPDPDGILGEPGSAPVIEVPIDDRFAAELCANPVLARFVLSVTFDTSRLTSAALDPMAEALVLRTNQSRFGAGDIASLGGDGRLSLSAVLPGAADEREIAERIQRGQRILLALVAGAPAPVEPEDTGFVGEHWLRV